jgi:carboxypeptidase Q
MLRRKFLGALLATSLLTPTLAYAQNAQGTAVAPVTTANKVYTAPPDVIAKIRDEGMNKSKIMETLSHLTDVIGPRLTNSPGMKRANEWTRDTMAKWGMQNAKLEPWGPFGRGWSLRSFNAQVVEPQTIALIAYPKAWTTSTKGAVTAEVIHFNPQNEADMEKYKGQLAGKIVLVGDTREVKADFGGMGTRRSDGDLKKMADWTPQAAGAPQGGPGGNPNFRQAALFNAKRWNFLLSEGAAVVVDSSSKGSGGTLFVQGATAVPMIPAEGATTPAPQVRLYDKTSESRIIPQMTITIEDANRLIRMMRSGVKPKMTVNIDAQYHDEDLMGYNTVAEIPGTDPALKDEVVMVGAHLDSWHSAGGATDNAAGSAVAMEAARILMAAGLKPRRTIRVALWSGEEQGLNGSREYVKQQFGEMKNAPGFGPPQPNAPKPELIKTANYDKLSVYYNLDNGTGKIRGVYMQGNAAVRPYFEAWLAPFADLGANTLTLQNTGGTDHLSYDRIGLPGFQFIQDEVEYSTRTHHSNQDNYDRIQADDMKQAATIMAAFVYQSAMMDEKMPRKTVAQ